MTTSDWIQLGILTIYTATLIVGGIIGLLQLNHIIVDINERQRQATADINERQQRIEVAGDHWRQVVSDAEKRTQQQDFQNKFIMVGLILINCVMWFILIRQDAKKP